MAGLPQIGFPQLGFATRVAALYVAMFIVSGVQMPFLPVWLRAKGLDPGMIGLVLAAPMMLRAVAIPIVTRLADRREAIRESLIGAAVLSVVGYSLLGLSNGPWLILATFALVQLTYTPVMPLAETYALRGLTLRGRAYGPVRLWGSAAFIAGNFAAGFVSLVIPAEHLIWMIVAASLLVMIAAVGLAPLDRVPPAAISTQPVRGHLLRDPAFLALVAAGSLIQGSHAVFYAFSALAWSAGGYSGTAIAALWALGVIAEIVLFALQSRLPLTITPYVLLMIGAGGAVIRWSAMAFDLPGAALSVMQLFHALSFGATHLAAMALITRHAPHGQAATAQGYYAVAMGVTMAVATGASGLLYSAFGGAAYAAMALMAVVGGGCALIAHRADRDRLAVM